MNDQYSRALRAMLKSMHTLLNQEQADELLTQVADVFEDMDLPPDKEREPFHVLVRRCITGNDSYNYKVSSLAVSLSFYDAGVSAMLDVAWRNVDETRAPYRTRRSLRVGCPSSTHFKPFVRLSYY
jgi:hypothetical protein